MIQVLQHHVLGHADPLCLFLQGRFVKKLAHLKTDLGIFIGIKGRDARFGGAEGFARQTFLLILIEEDVIGHHHLRPVRHQNLRFGHAPVHQTLNFFYQCWNMQSHAISDHTGGMIVKYSRRKCMQRELSIIIYNRMARIGSALETYDDVGFLSKHIRNLAFSLVTPVCSDDSFYHFLFPPSFSL